MITIRVTRDTGEMLLNMLHYHATAAETERERMIATQTFAVLAHAMHPDRYPAQPMRWADEPLPVVEVERQEASICKRCGGKCIKEHGLQTLCKHCGSDAERQRAYRERKKEKETEEEGDGE